MLLFKQIVKKVTLGGLCLLSMSVSIASHESSILKWRKDPTSPYICEGFYVEPLLINKAHTGMSVNSEHAEGILNQNMHLYGNVKIQRNDKLLLADRAHFYRDPKTKVLRKIRAEGHVSLQKPGQWMAGDKAILWRNLNKGFIDNAWYRFAEVDESKIVGNERQWYGVNGWGHATKIEQLNEEFYRLHDATYAACPPDKNIWKLEAKRLDIDKTKGEAYGYNTLLKIRDIPVLYWPYFSYPLNRQRKSGFLMPAYASTRRSGNDYSIPYYFNLAPNYDATLTPHYLALRGVLVEGEGRYMGTEKSSNLTFAYMNHDDKFARFQNKAKREGVSIHSTGSQRVGGRFQLQQNLSDQMSYNLDYSDVSDDYFYRDLSSNLMVGSQQHLLQKASWQYRSNSDTSNIQLSTVFQRYKTLHPYDEARVMDQYGLLPQINYQQQQSWQDSDLSLKLHTQLTNFKWPSRAIIDRVNGKRFVVDPEISYPMKPEYGFFIPTLHEHYVHYALRDADKYLNSNLQTVPDHKQISIPYITLDTGLYFDKIWSPRYTQTVMPRLFYVYVPNVEQSTVPIFDTGLNNFSEGYLFMPNRFSGFDRLGDTNQITYALSTEFKDLLVSRTFMKASIGQIHYFKDREQDFCYGRNCTGLNYLAPRAKVSPAIFSYHFAWGDNFSANASYAWQHTPRFATADLNYHGQRNHIYSLTYSYAKTNLTVDEQGNYIFNKFENFKASGSVPLTKNWHALGSWGYNLTDDHAHTYFLGGEYESCWWAFRLLGGQRLLYLDTDRKAHYDRIIFAQFLIKGLSSFGNNPRSLITAVLPGYEDQYSKRFKL